MSRNFDKIFLDLFNIFWILGVLFAAAVNVKTPESHYALVPPVDLRRSLLSDQSTDSAVIVFITCYLTFLTKRTRPKKLTEGEMRFMKRFDSFWPK